MSEDKIYLTVAKSKREPQKDGYVAVITRGQMQEGDSDVIVLDVEVVSSMKEAKRWFHAMMIERPWEPRQ
jgi:hypothetical protein